MLLTLVLNPEVSWLYIIHVCILSRFNRVQLFGTPWTVACQAPLSMEFSRWEYWRGLPCPPAGDLPDTGMEPMSLVCSASAGGFFTSSTTWEFHILYIHSLKIFFFIMVYHSIFLNWRIIAFNVVLASGVHQCESPLSTHIPCWAPQCLRIFVSTVLLFSMLMLFL